MQIIQRGFSSEMEADAFVEGLEFANDSDLEVCRITQESSLFIVTIHDQAESSAKEVCPICGAR